MPLFSSSRALILFVILMKGSAFAEAVSFTLVKEGVAKSVIILPDPPGPVAEYAARELQHHVEKASGARLQIVPEGQYTPEMGHAIYVGPTKALAKTGLLAEGASLGHERGQSWVRGANWKEEMARFAWNGRLHEGSLYFYGVDSNGPVVRNLSNAAGTLNAVYDFLEHRLGVRWIWPGPTGESIPKTQTIDLADYSQPGQPRFRNTIWRTHRDGPQTFRSKSGWKSTAAWERFHEEQDQWLLRQRFRTLSRVMATHAFEHYWKAYHAKHPEIFAELPNGKRERLPNDRKDGIDMAVCLSSPTLQRLIIDEWITRAPSLNWVDSKVVNIAGNDVSERCVCTECRAWDAPDPRFATHPYWGKGEISPTFRFMSDEQSPSLTDRYLRFALRMLEEAQARFRPDAEIALLAYTNYGAPPKETTLSPDYTVGIVDWPGINPWGPRTPHDLDALKAHWSGWQKSKANLYLRPNNFHVGWNMPIYYADRIGDAISYCANEGMMDADFDALTGQWATQASTYYMLGRKMVRPELPTETVLKEFYNAFGPAAEAVRAHDEHWKEVCAAVTTTRRQGMLPEDTGILEGRGSSLWGWNDTVFTPAQFQEGFRRLAVAEQAAGKDQAVLDRIAVLTNGLRLSEQMVKTVSALKAYEVDPNPDTTRDLRTSLEEMRTFRQKNEERLLLNVSYLHRYGEQEFDRRLSQSAIRQAARPVVEDLGPLPGAWLFRKDPENSGHRQQWLSEPPEVEAWASIEINRSWANQPAGEGYYGTAWYAATFQPSSNAIERVRTRKGKPRLALLFEAVDGVVDVFLDGQRIGGQHLPPEMMWDQPFTVFLPETLDINQSHQLRVRVTKHEAQAGIWKPVRLVIAAP